MVIAALLYLTDVYLNMHSQVLQFILAYLKKNYTNRMVSIGYIVFFVWLALLDIACEIYL